MVGGSASRPGGASTQETRLPRGAEAGRRGLTRVHLCCPVQGGNADERKATHPSSRLSSREGGPGMSHMSGTRNGSVHVTAVPPRVSVLGGAGGSGGRGTQGGAGLLTGILTATCVFIAVLFTVLASWMQDHALRRSARANLVAAACCALAAAVVPPGGQALPATMLVLAALVGAAGFHAARLGRG